MPSLLPRPCFPAGVEKVLCALGRRLFCHCGGGEEDELGPLVCLAQGLQGTLPCPTSRCCRPGAAFLQAGALPPHAAAALIPGITASSCPQEVVIQFGPSFQECLAPLLFFHPGVAVRAIAQACLCFLQGWSWCWLSYLESPPGCLCVYVVLSSLL